MPSFTHPHLTPSSLLPLPSTPCTADVPGGRGSRWPRLRLQSYNSSSFSSSGRQRTGMGESKGEGSAGTSAPTVPDKAEAPAHAAPSAAPVQGVPKGQHPQYYPQYQGGPGYQNRPLGYGSYGTQGAPGAATYPYHNQAQPQSFEVQEVHRPHERLPCLIGYQLIL